MSDVPSPSAWSNWLVTQVAFLYRWLADKWDQVQKESRTWSDQDSRDLATEIRYLGRTSIESIHLTDLVAIVPVEVWSMTPPNVLVGTVRFAPTVEGILRKTVYLLLTNYLLQQAQSWMQVQGVDLTTILATS